MLRRNAVRDVDVSRSPGEAASEQDDVSFQSAFGIEVSGYTALDGGFNQDSSATYTHGGDPAFLEKATFAISRNNHSSVHILWTIEDGNSDEVAAFYQNPGESISFDPAVRFEDGWKLIRKIRNPTPFPIEGRISFMWRDGVDS